MSKPNEIEILIGKMNTTFIDSKKRTWHILEREDGSVSVYYTTADSQAHYVVHDTLNIEPQFKITEEWLRSIGFEYDPKSDIGKILGFEKKAGAVNLLVGTWPFNEARLSIMHNGYTIVLNKLTRQAILDAMSLLEGCVVDEP